MYWLANGPDTVPMCLFLLNIQHALASLPKKLFCQASLGMTPFEQSVVLRISVYFLGVSDSFSVDLSLVTFHEFLPENIAAYPNPRKAAAAKQ